MAWTHDSQIGTTQNKTADQTSLVITTSATAAVGKILFFIIAKDNLDTSNGLNPNSVTGVTDSAGNIWRRLVSHHTGTGGQQNATEVVVFWTTVTVQLSSGGTITAAFGGSTIANDAQCGIVEMFSIAPGRYAMVIESGVFSGLGTAAADPADITLSNQINKTALWLWALSGEGPDTDTYTIDSDYTAITGTGTTGGVAASNQHVRAAYRIQSATSDTVTTSSDTADRDYAQVLATVYEVVAESDAAGQRVDSQVLVGY